MVAGTTVVISMLGLFAMGLSFMRGAAVVTILARPGRHGRQRSRSSRPCSATSAGTSTGCGSRWAARQRADRRGRRARRAQPRAGWPGAGSSRGSGSRAAVVGVARPARPGRAVPRRPVRLPRRRQRPRRHVDPAGVRHRRRRASAPAPTARCCSPPSCRPAPGAVLARRADRGLRSTPGVAAVTPATVNPAGDTAVLTVIPTTGPQSTDDRGPGAPPARRRHPGRDAGSGLDRPRRRRHRDLDRQHRATSPSGSRC